MGTSDLLQHVQGVTVTELQVQHQQVRCSPLERTHQLGNAPGFLHEAHRQVVLQQIAQASPDDDVIVSDQDAQRYHFPKFVTTGPPLNYLGPRSYSTTHRALSPPYVCIVLVFGRTNEPSL
jgi:hypothetical protein